MRQKIDVVVIDGGGTGTRLRALRGDGTPAAEATSGPSSLTLGVRQAWGNVAAGLEALAIGSDMAGARLVCGLAGGRSSERQAQFRAMADPTFADIVIVTDGFASLLGAHGGRPGVALAVGTGVNAYALGQDGRVSSASGWGFSIGDEGSGAWIGRHAVSLFSRHMDGRLDEASALFDALRSHVGDGFDAIQAWLSDANATKFATLAPAVIDAAASGDGLAVRIIDDAVAELERAIDAIDDGGPISLLGGLGPVFALRFSARLAGRLTPARGNALDGLALMARRGWREEVVPEVQHHDG